MVLHERYPLHSVQQGAHHALPAKPPQATHPEARGHVQAVPGRSPSTASPRAVPAHEEKFGRSGGDGEGEFLSRSVGKNRRV